MPANVTNGGGIDGLLNFERGPLKDSGEHVILFNLPYYDTNENYIITKGGVTSLANAMAAGDAAACVTVWNTSSSWRNGVTPKSSCASSFARTQHVKVDKVIVWGPEHINGITGIPTNKTLADTANLKAAGRAIQQKLPTLTA